ncbi:MAG: aminopeptidase [Candidatus Cloacimonetes bacterium]|nr:aminopeptidase [Candidatus Cloacimonadota bacterium]
MPKKEELSKKLGYQRTNFWKTATESEKKEAMKFAEGYKSFLTNCKTVRETVSYSQKVLEGNKFSAIEKTKRSEQKKYYQVYRQKNIIAAVIGKRPISEGINIVSPHIDTPRVDLKQNPLYEDSNTQLGMMRTHYYGGIKKYQWMSTPLALHGVLVKKSGEIVNISIGEDEKDPIFMMPDLLPHLAADQATQKIGDAIKASHMNVIFNSIPYPDEKVKEAVKLNALVILNERYGITEGDFLSAELELVPAGKVRDAGIDRSMIVGYGHDDRVCSYTSLQGLLKANPALIQKTALIFFSDKEEVGSEGNTGAKATQFIDFVAELLKKNGEKYDSYTVRKTLMNSQILSADVNAAINPNFPSVHEKDNAVHMGYGVSITKFTGVRGKAGSNDAHPEFTSKLIHLFNKEKVNWQMGALGQVDVGGGGTIAKFLAAYGADVIDCGTGVIGMHAPYELISKADLYSTYRAYHVFLSKA